MERNKSAIPTGSLVLLTKPNANGECKVFLRYYLGKYVKKCTDIRVPVEDWDEVHQCVKKTNRNSVRLNNELASIKSAVDEKLLAYKGRITLEVLQAALGKGEDAHEEEKVLKPSQQDFVEYAKTVNDMYYAKKDFGYTTWYNKNKYIEAFEWFVTKFDRSERVRLDTLNVEVFNRYIAYRFNDKKNKSKEGVNKTLVPLYDAIKYAVSVGLVSQKDVATILDNYVNMRNTEYNPEDDSEEVIRYLTDDEIKMIEEIQPKMKNQRTREIIDFFLFSYYACGLRLSDILTLEWSNIDFENKRIDKVQVKTKKKFEIALPLSKPAMEILLRWKGYNRNKRFVFDLLPEKYDLSDQKKLFMQRNAKDKTFNRSLHTVSMTLRLKTMATMHSARHSFAVMAINKGISIYLLSKLMGHSSISATEKTYAKFLKEKVDKDVADIMDL